MLIPKQNRLKPQSLKNPKVPKAHLTVCARQQPESYLLQKKGKTVPKLPVTKGKIGLKLPVTSGHRRLCEVKALSLVSEN